MKREIYWQLTRLRDRIGSRWGFLDYLRDIFDPY
jgi:hypothetical protein